MLYASHSSSYYLRNLGLVKPGTSCQPGYPDAHAKATHVLNHTGGSHLLAMPLLDQGSYTERSRSLKCLRFTK